jgi:N-acetyltransferase
VSASWTVPVTLHGARMLLTPLRLSDARDFVRALGGPTEAAEVTAHLSYRSPDLVEARRIITTALTTADQLPFAQRLAGTEEFVGTTSFYEIDPGRRTVAIGHTWLARRCWRTGVNTESKLLMLRHAFETLGAERVVWHTDIRNARSQAAIERLGATREGVLRHHRRRPDGSLRDTVQYSMVSPEWPDARQRLLTALERG